MHARLCKGNVLLFGRAMVGIFDAVLAASDSKCVLLFGRP